MSILRFDHLDEPIECADHTTYGVPAGMWRRDVSKAYGVAAALKAAGYGAARIDSTIEQRRIDRLRS
jgi:acyl-CoA reductase-like NAD-dependent aldehyde dehydrogenase